MSEGFAGTKSNSDAKEELVPHAAYERPRAQALASTRLAGPQAQAGTTQVVSGLRGRAFRNHAEWLTHMAYADDRSVVAK